MSKGMAGDRDPLGDCELDADGVPRRLPISDWPQCLERLGQGGFEQSEGELARIAGLLRGILRFGRPDGSIVFDSQGPDPAHRAWLRRWAETLGDPSLLSVARRWAPNRRDADTELPSPPPLPAFACGDRPLAILRPDWSSRGDWLAVDQRDRGGRALVELVGRGRRLLGPSWSSGVGEVGEASTGAPRIIYWKSGAEADLLEWSYPRPGGRVVRSALLLRGRGLALLAEQVPRGVSAASMDLELPKGVTAREVEEGRGLILNGGARLLPLASPMGLEGGGWLRMSGDSSVRLASGGRNWLPLLVSWNPERNRRPVSWFPLTVAERSRTCPPGVAFAARVAWGRDEGLVIYRSMVAPGLRTFLGHQTRSRFLVGRFGRDGVVRPLIRVDE